MKRRSLFDHLALQRLCEHDPPCGEKDLKQPRLARAGVFFYEEELDSFPKTECFVKKRFLNLPFFSVNAQCRFCDLVIMDAGEMSLPQPRCAVRYRHIFFDTFFEMWFSLLLVNMYFFH